MADFKEITTMKYWCQKVLPLVYDDSLSYYELLNKVVLKLNDLIENNKQLPDYISKLIQEYISTGAIGEVVRNILTDFMLNVKNPPNNLKPAVGDGTADDTEAIQGCIEYANSIGGGCVYVPNGVYLTQSLTLYDNVSLFGFDRYSSRLVLKGGATKPMFTGNVTNTSLTGLTIDGNMDIQVNNINLIDINADELILQNLVLTDGYVLVNTTVNKSTQISDVICDYSVVQHMNLSGSGLVLGSNIYLHDISKLKGTNLVTLNNNNSVLSNIVSNGEAPVGFIINGNNNSVSGTFDNAVIPFEDNGANNTIINNGKTEQLKITGNRTNHVGGNETNNINGKYEVNAENIKLNPTQPLEYKEPTPLDEYFKTIPFKNGNNNYDVLVKGETSVKVAIDGVNDRLELETQERIAKDNEILERIDTEISGAITDLTNKINLEKDERIAGDLNLQELIDLEESNRIESDNLISEALEDYISQNKKRILNVMDYGAKGDGVTDDTDSINTCITYAMANGIYGIVFPHGNYIVSSPLITINKALFLIGIGSPSILGRYTGTQPLIRFQGTEIEPTSGGIKNMRIISTVEHSGAVIECKYYNSIRFESVTCYYGSYGLFLVSSPQSFGCFITNSNFSSQSKHGFYTLKDSSLTGIVADVFIDGLIISASKEDGMHIESMSGLYCVNTDIIGCKTACMLSGYFGEISSLYFTNTLFDTSTESNLRVLGQINNPMNNIRFNNCWFSNSQQGYGADVSKATYISFVGCSFLVNFRSGVYCVDSSYVSFNSCNILANSRSSEVGASFYLVKNSTINGNQFGGYFGGAFVDYKQTYGVAFDQCTNSTLIGNVVTDNLNGGIPPHNNTNSKIIGNIGVPDEGVNYENPKTSKGTATFNGDGETTFFTIVHGLTTEPSTVNVLPLTEASTELHYFGVDNYKITVAFIEPPVIGVENIKFKWFVEE